MESPTIFPPSSTVEEAKSRFASALNSGVEKLLTLGHGRERAAKQVLDEITEGCSPDENEVRNISRHVVLIADRSSLDFLGLRVINSIVNTTFI
jgi:hypothetical protein